MARSFSLLVLLLTITAAAVAKKFFSTHPAHTYHEFKELEKKLKSEEFGLTYFELRNFAKGNITDTKVTVENEEDWGDKRYYPESNLEKWQIEADFSIICPEVVNLGANSSRFTMTLLYDDNSIEEFTINQQAVFDKPFDFKHVSGDRNMTYVIAGKQLEVIVFEDGDDALERKPKFVHN